MSAAVVLINLSAGGASADVHEWRVHLVARLLRGERLVTLFGRPEGAQVRVTAVVQDALGELHATRADVDPKTGFHTLSREFPSAHVFERELHEQHGVRVADHPWLKPVRFEPQGKIGIDDYPFYKMHGKETHEVQVGPVHAGVIEPGAFRFSCHGEVVHHLEIHLGYQHRGVERLLLSRDPRTLAPLVEQIAGDTSVAHTWAYAAAIESLARLPDAPERSVPRAAMLELERVAMHLAGLSGLATDVGFLQGSTTYGRLRTTAINASMRLCGSRFGRTAVRPAGSGVSLAASEVVDLIQRLDALDADARLIDERFLTSRTVRHRLADTGRVDTDLALQLGLVGQAARASGVAIDQRANRPGLWAGLPVVTRTSGDCQARAEIRIDELHASIAFLKRLLAQSPTWNRHHAPVGPLTPNRLVVALVEGWRGEVVHALETDNDGKLVHYKVQDPSLRNWMGLALSLRNNEISDFPICNKSFDLSYCGNDL